MRELLAVPSGRTARWVIAAVWVVLVFLSVGPLQTVSKFTEAEENSSTSFLPGDAESTKALERSEQITGGEVVPTVIVYRREGGLTAADRVSVRRDVQRINRLRADPSTPRFDATKQLDAEAVRPFRVATQSPRGDAILVGGDIVADGSGDTILDPIELLRETVSGDRDGLSVRVTGGAGFAADQIKVFENINGALVGAAFLLVLVLLAIIYRGPIIIAVFLVSIAFAEILSRSIGYGLTEIGVTVNGQSSSILSILVLGAGTDYALLLVARYREELRQHDDHREALALALRQAGPAIIASGLTVMLALLCLTIAKVNGTAGLGPIGALGIFIAMVTSLTILPAFLALIGRRVFWPKVPHVGDEGTDATHGGWRRLGERIALNPRRAWVVSSAILVVMALGLLNFSTGLTSGNSFRDEVESTEGQELIAQSFPAGALAPTDIVVPSPRDVPAVTRAASAVEGVDVVRPVARGEQGVLLQAILEPDPYSPAAFDLIEPLRAAVSEAAPGALVGGSTAVETDLREAATWDSAVIIPIVLVVVFIILLVLLRAVTVSLLLIGSVILSFAAALGVSALVYDVIFGFPGSDPSLPLFVFVFLVALGIDYNIFLMARVREETARLGTREGMLRGLAVTGGVITSAGIILAGVFVVLGVLPLIFLTQIGFAIAFGVLLDTFLVRSILVPALVLDAGPKTWWPSRLAREDHVGPLPADAGADAGAIAAPPRA